MGGALLNGEVFRFSRQGPFARDEATELVRLLNQITYRYSEKVNALVEKLECLEPHERQDITEIENTIGQIINEWNGKVRRLGGIPKGLWLVDIDNGQGYYCWKYPEPGIEYCHDYESGYAGRVPVEQK